MTSILFGIEEVDPQIVFRREQKVIEEGYKAGGWPSLYDGCIQGMISSMSERDLKVFEIQSSYGIYGWVVCKCVEVAEVA